MAAQGQVKQIVGSTLKDLPGEQRLGFKMSRELFPYDPMRSVLLCSELRTNFVSDKPSSWYSHLYQRDGLTGGHVIMLGTDDASRC